MSKYDVILIHPPAVYDFRQKPTFPGAMGATVEQVQFTKVPIGMLSLAEYLDRNGYKVIVDNLGDRMVNDNDFNVEQHLAGLSAGIFAVGLHFQQHSQGAIEIARLCKKLHPGSLVVLGGLTATRFHEEIIREYDFVDAVVRGEAEKTFLDLVRSVEKHGKLSKTPNLTYHTVTGEILVTPLIKPDLNLDEYEYTRFDLLEPRTSVFIPDSVPRWSLEVCRGCVYNCAICGGSAYTYQNYLGRSRPAFRSPGKIVEDIRKLSEQGIRFIGLYQDPRMGGKKYTRELIAALRADKSEIERLSLDLLVPSDEEFIREIASIGKPVIVHICPDTGSDAVRKRLGRNYSSEDLLGTIKLCHKYLIPVTSFFSVGLAGETLEDINETWELWDKLSSMESIAITRSRFVGLSGSAAQGGPIMGPIVLDPGSPAFDFPEKYGYKLLYRSLKEYIHGLSQPSWLQWINYETELLNRSQLVEVILQSMAFSIDQREANEFYSRPQAEAERLHLKADITALNELNRIQNLHDPAEIDSALKSLKNSYDSFLRQS